MKKLLTLLLICLQPLVAGGSVFSLDDFKKLQLVSADAEKEKPQETSFAAFPPETKAHVFSFLPHRSLKKAMLVCKEWKDIIETTCTQELYAEASFRVLSRKGIQNHPMKHLVKKVHGTLKPTLTAPQEEVISLLQNFLNLQELNFYGATGLSDEIFSAVLKASQLQTLDLRSVRLPNTSIAALATLPQLQTLYLRDQRSAEITDEAIIPLATAPNLKELYLHDCSILTNASIIALATAPNLQILDLQGCFRVTDTAPLANAPHLQMLCLSRCNLLTDASIMALATAPQLQLLHTPMSPAFISPKIYYQLRAKPGLKIIW